MPLGAGQDVGRSCIIIEVGGRTVMLDCGIHMVHEQKFPDFEQIRMSGAFPVKRKTKVQAEVEAQLSKKKRPNSEVPLETDYHDCLDLVIVSHFHLDHCGALPYFTEAIGYHGPVVATPPTKAILPLMLEDFRKVSVAQKGGVDAFSQEMIKQCINKIDTI